MTVVSMKPTNLICGTPNKSVNNTGMSINNTDESTIIRSRGGNDWDDE